MVQNLKYLIKKPQKLIKTLENREKLLKKITNPKYFVIFQS